MASLFLFEPSNSDVWSDTVDMILEIWSLTESVVSSRFISYNGVLCQWVLELYSFRFSFIETYMESITIKIRNRIAVSSQ